MTNRRRFEDAFMNHQPNIYAFAVNRCRDRHVADDVTAEVFLVAWRRIHQMPREPDTRAWLFGVARNVLSNSHRSVRRRNRLIGRLASYEPDINPNGDLADQAFGRPHDPDLAAALERLSENEREALLLQVWDELTIREIAAITDATENAVRIRQHRARRRLAELLSGPEPRTATTKRIAPNGHDPVSQQYIDERPRP